MPRRRRFRKLRRILVVGSAIGGVLAWRERKLTENQQRYNLP